MILLNIDLPKSCESCPLSYIDTGAGYFENGVRLCACSDVVVPQDEVDSSCPLIDVNVIKQLKEEAWNEFCKSSELGSIAHNDVKMHYNEGYYDAIVDLISMIEAKGAISEKEEE